jgi:hypothetical protein
VSYKRVSRKFSQKFVFERKLARKSTFLSKGFNFNTQTWFPGWYFTSTTANTSWVTTVLSKILHKFERAEKNFALFWENNFKTALRSGNTFCIKFKYCWKFLAFLLVEIQLFSAQKQMSFRRRTYMPYVHGGHHEWQMIKMILLAIVEIVE